MNGLHWIDILILALVFASVALVFAFKMHRRRRMKAAGLHGCGCSGDCGSCRLACHSSMTQTAGKK